MKIFYFTGSGNSLYAAKKIASALDGELVSIASQMSKESISIDAGGIGLVFPVYFSQAYTGIPLMVEAFLEKLSDIKGKYIFAAVTSGHVPYQTLENLDAALQEKGGKLSRGFVINTKQVSLEDDLKAKMNAMFKREHGNETQEVKQANNDTEKILSGIAISVAQRETISIQKLSGIKKILHAPYIAFIKSIFAARYKNLANSKKENFAEYIKSASNAFTVSNSCTGCGTCQNVCPGGNIEIIDNKPKWNMQCENCLACYQWCPSAAIGGEIVKYNERYHHPEITIQDMIIKY